MNIVFIIIWYVAVVVAGVTVFKVLTKTLSRAGHVRINFQGRNIPTSLGTGFVLLTMLMAAVVTVLPIEDPKCIIPSLFIVIVGFGLLGMLDDLVAGREAGGLAGHLSRIRTGGVVSTAILKLFFGISLSFFVSFYFWHSQGTLSALADTLILAMSANSINLLDVRPGRAVKGFAAGFLVIYGGTWIGVLFGDWAAFSPLTHILLVPFLLWTLVYARTDFRCKGMMGDTGSNVLGSALGFLVIIELSITNRLIILAFLIGFHLFCEAVSLSSIIESSSFLKKIDSFGVKTHISQKRVKK